MWRPTFIIIYHPKPNLPNLFYRLLLVIFLIIYFAVHSLSGQLAKLWRVWEKTSRCKFVKFRGNYSHSRWWDGKTRVRLRQKAELFVCQIFGLHFVQASENVCIQRRVIIGKLELLKTLLDWDKEDDLKRIIHFTATPHKDLIGAYEKQGVVK